MPAQIYLETGEYSVYENDGQMFVAILRSGDPGIPITIFYSTTTGTAGSADFSVLNSSVIMPAGVTRMLIPVSITNDALAESTEVFTFSIVGSVGAELFFPRTANVLILDDENPVQPSPEPPLSSDYAVTEVRVLDNLLGPISFEFLPTNPDIMLVAEKRGVIKIANIDTGVVNSVLIDMSAEVNEWADRGLMDIAVHPDFENHPYLYAFIVVDPPETVGQTGPGGPDGQANRYSQVVRFTLDAATGYTTIVPDSRVVLLGGGADSMADIGGGGLIDSTVDPTAPETGRGTDGSFINDVMKIDSQTHVGGALEFGPDGMLYVSVGDGTSPNRVDLHSLSVQNVNSLSGKILRVDPLTGLGLADNPFATGDLSANASKVYVMGLRNPYSVSFDAFGKLFITETGWNSWEEINTGPAGANFGWPFYEGGDLGVNQPSGYSTLPEAAAFYAAVANGTIVVTAPFRAFSHLSGDPGFQVQAITGASDLIYSARYPDSLQGFYIFNDVQQGEIYAVNSDDRRQVEYLFTDAAGYGPVNYQLGPDGYIYYADLVESYIGRLLITEVPNQPPNAVDDAVTAFISVFTPLNILSNDTDPRNDPFYITQINGQPIARGGSVQIATGVLFVYDLLGGVGLQVSSGAPTSVSFTYTIADRETFDLPLTDTANVVVTIQSAPPGTNFLVNGSFEQPVVSVGSWNAFTTVPGWTALAGGNIEIWRAFEGILASNGVNSLELDYFGALDGFSQTVNTVSGQAYTLTFDARLRTNFGATAATQGVEIVWNGIVIQTITPTSSASWTQFSVNVTGTGGADVLTIREVQSQSGDGLGALLDNFALRTATAPPVNTAPDAVNDTGAVAAGSSVILNVLSNDTDAQNNPLTITAINGTAIAVGAARTLANGASVTLNANGTLTYSAPAGTGLGAAPFTYTISDGSLSDTATVTMTINAPANTAPDAVNDTGTVVAGNSVVLNVLSNDTDAQNNPLTITAINGTAITVGASRTLANGASVTLNANGTLTYSAPAGTAPGAAPFTYTISDGSLTDTATVAMTINAPANTAPDAVNDTGTVVAGNSVVLTVLSNDTDAQNNPLTITAINGTAIAVGVARTLANGALLTLNANGTLTYSAPAGTTPGSAPFTYTISDGSLTDTATVAMTINAAPPSGTNLLVNGSFEQPTVTAGTWTVLTSVPGWTAIPGGEIEMWRAFEGNTASNGLNALELDQGGARDGFSQSVQTQAGQTYTLTFDARLRTTHGAAPSSQAVEIVWNGTVVQTITPTSGTSWTQFSAVVTGTGGSDVLTIREVQSQSTDGLGALLDNFALIAGGTPPPNTAPDAVNDSGTVTAGSSIVLNVLGNDTDAQGNALTITAINGAAIAVGATRTLANGASVTLNANGTLTYTAPTGTSPGAAPFTYTISDGSLTDTATVAMTINAPPPVGTNLLVNGSFEQPVVTAGTWTVLTSVPGWNAIAGGEIEMWRAFEGNTASNGVNALELDQGGARDGFSQSVSTVAGQAYTLTFDARLRTTHGAAPATQAVEIVWNGVVVQTITPTSGTSWTQFSATVTGTGGADVLTIREVQSQSGDGLGALLDNFSLVAGGTPPPNTAPDAVDDSASVTAGASVTLNVLENDTDAQGNTLSITAINGSAITVGTPRTLANGASVTLNANGTLTYAAPAGTAPGGAPFTYTISDGSLTDTATVNVTINPPPPSGTNLLVNGSFEQPVVSVGSWNAFTTVPGWTALAGGNIEIWRGFEGITASNGVNSLELDYFGGRDGFSQSVNTVSGQAYTLTFDARLRTNFGATAATQSVEIVWNGIVVQTITPTSSASWTQFSVNVTGTGGANVLTIREVISQSGDGLGALLDNFSLVAVSAGQEIAASPEKVPVSEVNLDDPESGFVLPSSDGGDGAFDFTELAPLMSGGSHWTPTALIDGLMTPETSFDFWIGDRIADLPDLHVPDAIDLVALFDAYAFGN